MSKDIMTSGIEMSDVIKTTGFPVPEDMEGKTFAECVSGGGSGDITVVALSATENKVYTAPEGKAYSPVTVNVPSGGDSVTLYAWKDISYPDKFCYTYDENPSVGDTIVGCDAGGGYAEIIVVENGVAEVGENQIIVGSDDPRVDVNIAIRDSTKDIMLG